jgi:hypothetical protein
MKEAGRPSSSQAFIRYDEGHLRRKEAGELSSKLSYS